MRAVTITASLLPELLLVLSILLAIRIKKFAFGWIGWEFQECRPLHILLAGRRQRNVQQRKEKGKRNNKMIKKQRKEKCHRRTKAVGRNNS